MQAQATTTANKTANGAHAPVASNAPVMSVIPRKDLLGQPCLFLPDTQNKETGTLSYWDGKKGSKPQEAPIQFYKSTVPLDKNSPEAQKLVTDFSKETGVKQFIVRQRLVKENVQLQRGADGSIASGDIDAFKERLIAAITKAIRETM